MSTQRNLNQKNTPTNIPTKRISPNPAQITETQTKTKPIHPHQPTLPCQSEGRRQHIPSSADTIVNEQTAQQQNNPLNGPVCHLAWLAPPRRKPGKLVEPQRGSK
jgi:hypothetical protein